MVLYPLVLNCLSPVEAPPDQVFPAGLQFADSFLPGLHRVSAAEQILQSADSPQSQPAIPLTFSEDWKLGGKQQRRHGDLIAAAKSRDTCSVLHQCENIGFSLTSLTSR